MCRHTGSASPSGCVRILPAVASAVVCHCECFHTLVSRSLVERLRLTEVPRPLPNHCWPHWFPWPVQERAGCVQCA
eukprot:6227965-Amphidinium_carterae.1